MIVNISYEVDTEKIAQNIIDNLGETLYVLDIPFSYDNLSEEEERKLIVDIAEQMTILAKE